MTKFIMLPIRQQTKKKALAGQLSTLREIGQKDFLRLNKGGGEHKKLLYERAGAAEESLITYSLIHTQLLS